MIRDVLLHPHPLLTRRAGPATDPGPVVADLLDTMRSFGHCVGIAAPQIGELVRVAVVDCSGHPKARIVSSRSAITASGSLAGSARRVSSGWGWSRTSRIKGRRRRPRAP